MQSISLLIKGIFKKIRFCLLPKYFLCNSNKCNSIDLRKTYCFRRGTYFINRSFVVIISYTKLSFFSGFFRFLCGNLPFQRFFGARRIITVVSIGIVFSIIIRYFISGFLLACQLLFNI